MSNKSDYLTDTITESRHYAFRRVLPGYPEDPNETLYRVLAGKEFDAAKCQATTRRETGRGSDSKFDHMDADVADDYDWYIMDREATIALRERLILNGEDNLRYEGQQYRPARLGEPYDLLVRPDGSIHKQNKSINEVISGRHYVLREVQQPESEEILESAIKNLVTAIKTATNPTQ